MIFPFLSPQLIFQKYQPNNQPTTNQDTQISAAWNWDPSVCPTSKGRNARLLVVVDGGIWMFLEEIEQINTNTK